MHRRCSPRRTRVDDLGVNRCFRYCGTAASIATRAISWRNRRSSPSLINRPWLISSSTTSGLWTSDTSSSDCIREPISAATLSASRAGVPNVLVRARTASRMDSGRASLPASSTSETKNGLPSVSRCSSVGSIAVPCASVATPAADRVGKLSRRVARWLANAPSVSRSGLWAISPSSRYVTRSSTCRYWIRRLR